MKIRLNNIDEIISIETLTIKELLGLKNFTFKMLVVKINGTLIRQADYETTMIKDGDNVVVMHLVSGG